MTIDRVSALGRGAGRWATRVLLLLCAAVLAVGASQVLSGRYQVHPVLTGSMRPGFALGSVVVVKRVPASSLAVRDVLLFHKPTNPSEYVVHRIVKITDKGGTRVIETKGDDNPVKDPWTFTLRGHTAYTAQFTIPFVGYAALWLHQPDTRRYAMFAAATLLLLMAASVLFKRPATAAPEPDSVAEHHPADPAPAAVFAEAFATAFYANELAQVTEQEAVGG